MLQKRSRGRGLPSPPFLVVLCWLWGCLGVAENLRDDGGEMEEGRRDLVLAVPHHLAGSAAGMLNFDLQERSTNRDEESNAVSWGSLAPSGGLESLLQLRPESEARPDRGMSVVAGSLLLEGVGQRERGRDLEEGRVRMRRGVKSVGSSKAGGKNEAGIKRGGLSEAGNRPRPGTGMRPRPGSCWHRCPCPLWYQHKGPQVCLCLVGSREHWVCRLGKRRGGPPAIEDGRPGRRGGKRGDGRPGPRGGKRGDGRPGPRGGERGDGRPGPRGGKSGGSPVKWERSCQPNGCRIPRGHQVVCGPHRPSNRLSRPLCVLVRPCRL
ncbi:collagen alpha-2(VI) chain-like [Amia ocellicauda]|uniref:collagen alpha-2(VI) chain-like n=1 Tax=Amia ocellicauda TaxID=2972642 RepID=UPI003463F29F